jgi:Tfp pilus assembly protein PilV
MVSAARGRVWWRVRRGSSLIEALIALVLFQFGMLALVATSAVAARDLAAANRHARAQALAANRVEQLRAQACPASLAGSMSWPGGLTEYWRVEASGMRRIISDSVELLLPRGRRASHVMQAHVLCSR